MQKYWNKSKSLLLSMLFVGAFFSSACGVKGPPLPPVAGDPADSERSSIATPEPSPSSSVNPDAVKNVSDKKTKKRPKPKPTPSPTKSSE